MLFFLIKNGETVIQDGPVPVVKGGWGYNPTKKGPTLYKTTSRWSPVIHPSVFFKIDVETPTIRSILKDEISAISVSYNCGGWTTASRVDPGKSIRKSVSKHIFCCSDIIPVERLGSLAFCKMFLDQVVENWKAISPATIIFKLYNPCLPSVRHNTKNQNNAACFGNNARPIMFRCKNSQLCPISCKRSPSYPCMMP